MIAGTIPPRLLTKEYSAESETLESILISTIFSISWSNSFKKASAVN